MASKIQNPSTPGEHISNFVSDIGDTYDSFIGGKEPTPKQLLTQQGSLPSWRTGKTTRHVLKFLCPNQPMVKMYVNPEQLVIAHTKTVQGPTRTKG